MDVPASSPVHTQQPKGTPMRACVACLRRLQFQRLEMKQGSVAACCSSPAQDAVSHCCAYCRSIT